LGEKRRAIVESHLEIRCKTYTTKAKTKKEMYREPQAYKSGGEGRLKQEKEGKKGDQPQPRGS